MKYWDPETYEVNSHSWPFKLNRRGKIDKWKDTYMKLNELGFRGNSIFDEGYRIMTVGCSHTEGACVNDDETWPYYLSQMIGCLHYNCSVAGSSNDFITRTIHTFTDIIKPNIVLVMYTAIERFEHYRDGNIYAFAPNAWGYFTDTEKGKEEYKYIVACKSRDNDQINWYKNHLLISNYLKFKSIPFYWNKGFAHTDTDLAENNRFYGDYTNFMGYTYDTVHASPEHNKRFAEEFYKFLKDKNAI